MREATLYNNIQSLQPEMGHTRLRKYMHMLTTTHTCEQVQLLLFADIFLPTNNPSVILDPGWYNLVLDHSKVPNNLLQGEQYWWENKTKLGRNQKTKTKQKSSKSRLLSHTLKRHICCLGELWWYGGVQVMSMTFLPHSSQTWAFRLSCLCKLPRPPL